MKNAFKNILLRGKKKDNTKGEKKIKSVKSKKLPVIKLGTHRKMTILLWMIFISGFIFAVYRNFTAIDTHTVREKEIIKEKVMDTSAIYSFTVDFIKTFYTWENNKEYLIRRNESLKNFLTDELIKLNTDTLRSDIPTSSALEDIKIWEIKDVSKESEDCKTYGVIFSIKQLITDTDMEFAGNDVFEGTDNATGETAEEAGTVSDEVSNTENKTDTNDIQSTVKERYVNATYSLEIYADSDKNMVIVKNPTMSAGFTKSMYEPKIKENIAMDSDKQLEILEFLKTFFTLYPGATAKELSYYVKGNVLKPVEKKYIFSELINPVFYKEENDNVSVSLSVKYLDEDTKMIQIFQYDLVLTKEDNWVIVK